ncbi:MAG: type II toxin-antitoxin system RelE/ParE family toxin [Thermodesulfobacteriota bacterium]|nr:type II toxin-antitoxin system RelE/ParE family toxin [Thermodesulfobacteriota bacterium]
MNVRFLEPAEVEMFEAAAYYELQVSTLGENFLDIIENAIDGIVDHPEICPETDRGIRSLVVRRFPFSILYQIFNNELL